MDRWGHMSTRKGEDTSTCVSVCLCIYSFLSSSSSMFLFFLSVIGLSIGGTDGHVTSRWIVPRWELAWLVPEGNVGKDTRGWGGN